MRNTGNDRTRTYLTAVIRAASAFMSTVSAAVLLLAALLIISAFQDINGLTKAGIRPVRFTGFDDLIAQNPDTVAWIRMDNTNIDHPVVCGKDNYEYLDKDFYGEDYAGGCIFIDCGCSRDLTDSYIVIHGHHMHGGAMFGDLEKYMDKDFFEGNKTGELLTPACNYELTVTGAGIRDAYDSDVYSTGPDRERPDGLIAECELSRKVSFRENDKLILLSTCSGDMSNDRIVVLCRARAEESTDE